MFLKNERKKFYLKIFSTFICFENTNKNFFMKEIFLSTLPDEIVTNFWKEKKNKNFTITTPFDKFFNTYIFGTNTFCYWTILLLLHNYCTFSLNIWKRKAKNVPKYLRHYLKYTKKTISFLNSLPKFSSNENFFWSCLALQLYICKKKMKTKYIYLYL